MEIVRGGKTVSQNYKASYPHREIRQRVPGKGEEVEVHRGPEGAVQVAAAEGRRRAPAQERDRDSGDLTTQFPTKQSLANFNYLNQFNSIFSILLIFSFPISPT